MTESEIDNRVFLLVASQRSSTILYLSRNVGVSLDEVSRSLDRLATAGRVYRKGAQATAVINDVKALTRDVNRLHEVMMFLDGDRLSRANTILCKLQKQLVRLKQGFFGEIDAELAALEKRYSEVS